MNNAEELQKLTFVDYYKSLLLPEQKRIREQFIRETGIAYPTFYSKMKRNNYSLLERKTLENLCDQSFSW